MAWIYGFFYFVLSCMDNGHVIAQPSIQECLLIIYRIHPQFHKSVVNQNKAQGLTSLTGETQRWEAPNS